MVANEGPGVAVVGRHFGGRVHVPALRAAGLRVLALVGRDRERTAHRADQLGIPHACASLTEALEVSGVEAVTIATPPDTHAPLSRQAVDAGRHVICEKPFTLDAGEAAALHEAATRAGVVNLVGHEFRWGRARVALGAAIADGRLGDPRVVSLINYATTVTDAKLRLPSWFSAGGGIGGWIGASGSHTFDQVRVWLGEFDSVSAATVVAAGDGPVTATGDGPVTATGDGPAEDSFVVRFRLRSGVEGVAQQVGASWAAVDLTVVTGTRATAGIAGGEPWISDHDGRRPLSVPSELGLPGSSDDGTGGLERLSAYEVSHYTRLCQAFRAAIEGVPHNSPVPVPTFADGLACMEVIDAVRRSAAAGGAVVAVNQITS